MSMLNKREEGILRNYKLMVFYLQNRTMLDDMFKQVYRELKNSGNSVLPTKQEVLGILELRVELNPEFVNHMGVVDPHMSPNHYSGYASMLAKYIIDQNWQNIGHP